VTLDCRWANVAEDSATALGELPPSADNLATKAVELLRLKAGITAGIRLQIFKRIPAAAGLGGASSDAAAALVAANELWNLGWSTSALAEVGAELGSDVPFFLYQTAAVCRGRGEQIEPIAGVAALDYVVVRPPQGLATAAVYARCQVPSAPRHVAPLLEALEHGDCRQLRQLMHNRLEPAASGLSCWIGRLEREFAASGCLAAQMSGSGSSYFGICRHARQARRVARRLAARGLGEVMVVRGCG